MYVISAPYPGIETNLYLPDADFRNSVTPQSTVKINKTLDNSFYTYVRRNPESKIYVYTFDLTREKTIEMETFFDKYHSSKLKLLNHDDETLICYLVTNPIIFSPNRKINNTEGSSVELTFELCEL